MVPGLPRDPILGTDRRRLIGKRPAERAGREGDAEGGGGTVGRVLEQGLDGVRGGEGVACQGHLGQTDEVYRPWFDTIATLTLS